MTERSAAWGPGRLPGTTWRLPLGRARPPTTTYGYGQGYLDRVSSAAGDPPRASTTETSRTQKWEFLASLPRRMLELAGPTVPACTRL